ncbi:MAG TPA: hypothetical protein VF575_03795 [Candidatus Saccharimonadales bacterium]|jgi:hypothetical protein
MTDNTADEVYDDPDNILAETDDTVSGATELPGDEADDPSQSIFTPELGDDDRGTIPELEAADGGSKHDEADGNYPEDADPDSDHLGDMDPADEQDGTER